MRSLRPLPNFAVTLALVLVLLSIPACRSGDDSRNSNTPRSPSPTLELKVLSSPGNPRATQPITLTLELTARVQTTLRFSSGQRYDLIVRDQSGNKVWQSSDGKVFTQVLGQQRLEAGKKLTFEDSWTPEIPGFYTIKGVITSTNPIEAEVAVAVAR